MSYNELYGENKKSEKDILNNKQIALFLGAGVNCFKEIKPMWTQMLNPIFRSALYRFSAGHGFQRFS